MSNPFTLLNFHFIRNYLRQYARKEMASMSAANLMLNKQQMHGIPDAYGIAVPISTQVFVRLRSVCMAAPRFGEGTGGSVSISWEGPPLLQTD
ncbi:MAG TPA: hypothetical protein VH593_22855 [Ktedonobacteraceae bacterium]|jgi:hypothetical protein